MITWPLWIISLYPSYYVPLSKTVPLWGSCDVKRRMCSINFFVCMVCKSYGSGIILAILLDAVITITSIGYGNYCDLLIIIMLKFIKLVSSTYKYNRCWGWCCVLLECIVSDLSRDVVSSSYIPGRGIKVKQAQDWPLVRSNSLLCDSQKACSGERCIWWIYF